MRTVQQTCSSIIQLPDGLQLPHNSGILRCSRASWQCVLGLVRTLTIYKYKHDQIKVAINTIAAGCNTKETMGLSKGANEYDQNGSKKHRSKLQRKSWTVQECAAHDKSSAPAEWPWVSVFYTHTQTHTHTRRHTRRHTHTQAHTQAHRHMHTLSVMGKQCRKGEHRTCWLENCHTLSAAQQEK